MNATGTNTAESTSAMAITGAETSSIALSAASRGDVPCLRCVLHGFDHHDRVVDHERRWRGSSPKSERVLSENPSSGKTCKVPTSETGTAKQAGSGYPPRSGGR
mgnify:CR=1 FL=1